MSEVIQHVKNTGPSAFYVEHNYHTRHGLGLDEVLGSLLDQKRILPDVADSCRANDTIWYGRLYPYNRNGFYEAYGPSLEYVVDDLLLAMERYGIKMN